MPSPSARERRQRRRECGDRRRLNFERHQCDRDRHRRKCHRFGRGRCRHIARMALAFGDFAEASEINSWRSGRSLRRTGATRATRARSPTRPRSTHRRRRQSVASGVGAQAFGAMRSAGISSLASGRRQRPVEMGDSARHGSSATTLRSPRRHWLLGDPRRAARSEPARRLRRQCDALGSAASASGGFRRQSAAQQRDRVGRYRPGSAAVAANGISIGSNAVSADRGLPWAPVRKLRETLRRRSARARPPVESARQLSARARVWRDSLAMAPTPRLR